MRALRSIEAIPAELVGDLEGLPGFRNVLVHEYVALDYGLVLEVLGKLDAVERFARAVARLES